MIPFTTIPLISAGFLILIGVLIGHLIWYRYHDEHEDSDSANSGQNRPDRDQTTQRPTPTSRCSVWMLEDERAARKEKNPKRSEGKRH